MLGRMQHFVDGFIAQCRKHRPEAELILVEWNPPPERPPLEEALEWPADFGRQESASSPFRRTCTPRFHIRLRLRCSR